MGIVYSINGKWASQERQNGTLNASRKLIPAQEQITQLKKAIAHLKEVNQIIKKNTRTLSTIRVDNIHMDK